MTAHEEQLLARIDERVTTLVSEIADIKKYLWQKDGLDSTVAALVAEAGRSKTYRGWREQIIAGLIVSGIIGVVSAVILSAVWIIREVGV